MIDLYTALKLMGDFNSNSSLVHLKNSQNKYGFNEHLTVKEVKDKYDLRKTKVIEISPYFCCECYGGFLLTIQEEKDNE